MTSPTAVSSRLVDDYPAPLTAAQRLSVQRHVGQQIHKYTVIDRTTRVVQRGLASLQQLIARLDGEAASLQQRMTALASSTTATTTDTTATATATDHDDGQQHDSSSSSRSSVSAPARRARGVGVALRRGAMLASMQSVLQRARTDADGSLAQLSRTRERIALQTRLSLVHEDVARQRALLAPLQHKLARCVALASEAAAEVHTLLALYDDMLRMEADYAACFVLKAVARVAATWTTTCASSLQQAGGATHEHAQTNNDDDDEDDKATTTTTTTATTTATTAAATTTQVGVCYYAIPCQPAQFTPECEDMLRGQIDEQLDSYLAYRSRVDAVLQRLAQEAHAHERHRVDQLMQVIGMGVSGGKDVLGDAASAATPVAAVTLVDGTHDHSVVPPPPQPSSSSSMLPPHRALDISSSSSDDDDDDGGGATTTAAAGTHKRPRDAADHGGGGDAERAHIQSALLALDDFEDMY